MVGEIYVLVNLPYYKLVYIINIITKEYDKNKNNKFLYDQGT